MYKLDLSKSLNVLKQFICIFVGIKALAESVNMVANGIAPRINQTEEGATYDPALFKPETHQVSSNENLLLTINNEGTPNILTYNLIW